MADVDHVNFDDLEPNAVTQPVDSRFARSSFDVKDIGVSRFRYGPGERLPFGHRHREQEEAYVVVSGSGQIKLDDELRDVREGDVLRLAPHVARGFIAGPDGLEVLCFGGPRPEGGDGEPVEGFWDS